VFVVLPYGARVRPPTAGKSALIGWTTTLVGHVGCGGLDKLDHRDTVVEV
jgi:hypothetical protein